MGANAPKKAANVSVLDPCSCYRQNANVRFVRIANAPQQYAADGMNDRSGRGQLDAYSSTAGSYGLFASIVCARNVRSGFIQVQ
jgi:hypothetical protein